MNEISLLNRYKGAMVGVHVGDAIGAPYETWSAKKIATDIENRGGLTFFDYENPWKHELGPKILPEGRPTDDSDQTADLAWSLIECNGLDTEHLREALRDSVIRHKSRLWDGAALGAGGTTKKALSDDPVKIAEAMNNNIGTNGSLMRCTPLALWLHQALHDLTSPEEKADEIWTHCASMSHVTHAHRTSKWACSIYTHVMHSILNSATSPINAILGIGDIEGNTLWRILGIKLANMSVWQPIDPGAWPGRGEVEFSLYTALWCFMHSTSFKDGIERAVRIGGDTDTYAAIAGGLLGAYYGYEAIPFEWRQTILGHDVMMDYAQTLLCGKIEPQ